MTIVPPTYPEGCKVVFVGESPGPDECEAGEGFVGKAGRVLQKIIRVAGLSWDQIGRTNVVKRPPDGGYDSEAFKATFYQEMREGRKKVVRPSSELIGWYDELRRELEVHRPAIVVACGNEALKALTGLEGISKHRGSILQSTLVPDLAVVPMMHPSWILRGAQWQELYISGEVLSRKVVPNVERTPYTYRTWQEELQPTIEQVRRFIRDASEASEFTLDIETRAGTIACVGLAYGRDGTIRAICVPIQSTRGPYWSAPDELEFWRGLNWLLERVPVVGHNLTYDLDWLRDYGIVPWEVHDTMLLFHRMYAELPKGLDFVNMWYTDIPYYKDDGKTWGRNKPDQQLWSYNVKDVVATLWAWHAMKADALSRHTRAWTLYQSYTRPLMRVAFEMQSLGMIGSPEGLLLAQAVVRAETDKIMGRLEALSDGKLVVLPHNKKVTDDQVKRYLYDDLKLPPKRNFKTKTLTADEDALVELMIAHPELDVLKAILAERKFSKAMSGYLKIKWRQDADLTG